MSTMLIYAKQPIFHVIDNFPHMIKKLYLAKELNKKDYAALMKKGFEVKRIPNEAAQKMCKNANHQGFLAEIEDYQLASYKTFFDKSFILVLSGLTDVGNIGALVRSAYALGVDAIVACGVKSLSLEGIVRTSTGTLLAMPFAIEKNIFDVLNDFKLNNFTSYGAEMDGEDVNKVSFEQKKVLVLGNEGEGLSARLVSKLDKLVSIKMNHQFDSLNVSVAGGILMDRMRTGEMVNG